MNLNFGKIYWKEKQLFVICSELDEDVDVGFVIKHEDDYGKWMGCYYFNGERDMNHIPFDSCREAKQWVEKIIKNKIKEAINNG